MKTPRRFSYCAVSVLLLGCALLALSPVPSAVAQKKMPPPITLTSELLDKVEKVTKLLSSDAAAKTELDTINHQKELDPTVAETDDAIAKKYPKLGAVYQAAGLKPHEFVGAFITMLVAGRTIDNHDSASGTVSQANIDFVKANRERVKAIVKAVIGQED